GSHLPQALHTVAGLSGDEPSSNCGKAGRVDDRIAHRRLAQPFAGDIIPLEIRNPLRLTRRLKEPPDALELRRRLITKPFKETQQDAITPERREPRLELHRVPPVVHDDRK